MFSQSKNVNSQKLKTQGPKPKGRIILFVLFFYELFDI